MPRIPDYVDGNNQFPINPPATDISPERFGKDAAALAELGGKLGDIGSNLLQARKKALENDSVFNANMKHQQMLAKTTEEERLKLGQMDDNGILITERGFSDRVNNRMQEQLKTDLDNMPTGDAQRMLLSKSGQMIQSAYIQNSMDESKIIAVNGLQNRDTRSNRKALDLAVMPMNQSDNALAIAISSMADDFRSGSESGEYSISQAHPYFKKAGRDAVLAYFDGLSKNKEGIEKGLRILDARELTDVNKPEDGPINLDNPTRYAAFKDLDVSGQKTYLADFIDSNDFKRIRHDLESKRDYSNGYIKESNLNIVRDAVSQLERGDLKNFSDKPAIQAMQTLGGMVGEGPHKLSPDEFNRINLELAYSLTVADAMNRSALTPLNEKDKVKNMMNESVVATMQNMGIPQEQWGQYGDKIRSKLDHNFDVNWKHMQSRVLSDPAQFVLDNKIAANSGQSLHILADQTKMGSQGSPQDINKYFASLISAQVSKGVPPENIKLLTNQQAQIFKSAIQEQENPTVAGAAMLQMQDSWGPYATKNFKQMTDMKHGLDKKYLSALHLGNVDFAKTAIEAIRNPNADDILKVAGREDDSKAIDKAVPTEMSKYMNPILDAGDYAKNSDNFIGMQKIVSYRAKQLAAQGVPNQEAAKQATQELIGQSFTKVGTTLVPNRIGSVQIDKPWAIDAEMKYRASKEYLMQNADIPLDARGGPSAKKLEQAIDFNRTKWVFMADGSGSRLEVKLKNGKFTPLFDKNTKKPITVDYVDIGNRANNSDGALKYIERN